MYCDKTIWPRNEEGLETLARYIIRASFSQGRMTYIAVDDSADGTVKVLYESKDGKAIKTFDALDWPRQRAAGCKHSDEGIDFHGGKVKNLEEVLFRFS